VFSPKLAIQENGSQATQVPRSQMRSDRLHQAIGQLPALLSILICVQMKRERHFWPLSFELIAPTEPLLGTACVLPTPMLTSGEKSSRKSGNNNYAERLLQSVHRNNLIWMLPGKPTAATAGHFEGGCASIASTSAIKFRRLHRSPRQADYISALRFRSMMRAVVSSTSWRG
jgi:hypothetical protein